VNDDSFLIGESRQTREVRALCVLYGPRNLTVLVLGETGTGKSVVAAELHRLSARSRHPLGRIAARELRSPEMVQAKLAGVVRGAYTSDDRDRGVPFLSDLPVIGGLFGRQSVHATDTELFLFLTPRVLRTHAESDSATQRYQPPRQQ
jgi:hypothetical protein